MHFADDVDDKPLVVDVNADDNSKFKRQQYWDTRFKDEESYDWLLTYSQVRDSLFPYLKPTDRILIVGCGNSTFSADLYDDGFHNLVNIDFSDVVIERMRAIHRDARPLMRWEVMDMCDLTYEDSSFDVVIDKAAMDALLVDEGDCWDPEPSVVQNVHRMCVSLAQVLTKTGLFLQISFAQPHFRTKYLMGERKAGSVTELYSASMGRCLNDLYPWRLSYVTLSGSDCGGCLNSFLYVMSLG